MHLPLDDVVEDVVDRRMRLAQAALRRAHGLQPPRARARAGAWAGARARATGLGLGLGLGLGIPAAGGALQRPERSLSKLTEQAD